MSVIHIHTIKTTLVFREWVDGLVSWLFRSYNDVELSFAVHLAMPCWLILVITDGPIIILTEHSIFKSTFKNGRIFKSIFLNSRIFKSTF